MTSRLPRMPYPARRPRRLPAALGATVITLFGLGCAGGADAPPEPGPVLAVFPFENRSLDPEEAHLAAGVRHELLGQLSALDGLRIISPRSPDIRAGFGVEGSVAREGDRMVIEASIRDLQGDEPLWSGRLEGARGQLPELQVRLAEALASAVGRELSVEERAALAAQVTAVPDAHDHVLRGHDLGHTGEASDQAGRGARWREAVSEFERAAELDPQYVSALAGLAFHHLRLYWFGYDRTPGRLELAREPLERAVALAPDSPEVLTVQGYWYYWGHLDYERSAEHYRAAQALQPGNTQLSTLIAFVIRRQGLIRETAELLAANSDLDPTDAGLALEAGDTWHAAGEWELARRYLERARDGAPGHPGAYLSLGWVAIGADGDVAAAREVMEEGARMAGVQNFVYGLWRVEMLDRRFDAALARLEPATDEAFVTPILLHPMDQLAGLALLAAGDAARAAGRLEAAGRLLERLAPEFGDDHRIHRAVAVNEAALGRAETAVAAADRGVAARSLEVDAFVGGDPVKDRAWALALAAEDAVDPPALRQRALDDLERMVDAPTLVPLTRHHLDLDLRWDPLRQEERFQALLRR